MELRRHRLHHRIVVEADTFGEAFLIAGQMGSSVDIRHLAGRPVKGAESAQEGDVMCTGVYWRMPLDDPHYAGLCGR